MVKCMCGRLFKNLGKLSRHLKIHNDDPSHVPDKSHELTEKAFKRYNKHHKREKVNHGNESNPRI